MFIRSFLRTLVGLGLVLGLFVAQPSWAGQAGTRPRAAAHTLVVSADTTPPGAVQDLFDTPGDTTVQLDWVNPTDSDLQKIQVFYQEGFDAPAYGVGTEVTLASPLATSVNVTGLTNDTTYTFAVYAVDSSSNVSDPNSVTSTPYVSTGVDPVSGLQAAGAGPTGVTLTWNNPPTLDGIVVRYSTTEAPSQTTDGTGWPVTGTPEATTVTGLTTGTHYYFSVFAVSSGVASPATSVDFTPFSCPDLSTALDAPTGLVTGSSYIACSAADANANDNTLTTLLPRVGPTQALMTSGDAAIAAPPDKGGGEGRDNGSGSRGAYDVSIYKLDLNVPAGAQCLSFDFVFASDEYPEFVGSAYNDGFLAQLDQNVWSVDPSTSAITATGNFARTADGGYISVNSPVFADPSKVADPSTNGTAYDGMSVPLRASTPVSPGAHSIYLSIFDAGDGILDSAAFIDHLQTGTGTCAAGSHSPPNAVDDTATTPSGQAVSTNVLTNDTDPASETLSVTGHTDGAHGTVSCTSTACTYVPSSASYVGPDSYTYTISNTDGLTDTATVNVSVTNRAPHAVADSANVSSGGQVITQVLMNDTDPEGQSLSVSGHTNGAHGTVSCTATACTYTSTAPYAGGDSYTYTLSDGNGGTDTGTVTVTVVSSGAQPPNAVDDTATTPSGQAVSTNVLTNDTDPANETLSVTGHTHGAHGTVTCTSTACTYTPSSASYVGPDSYTYTISNTEPLTDTATVNVTVTNRAPHAVADSGTVVSGGQVTTQVLTNDTDPEGQSLSVSGHTNGAHGTVSCTATACTYTSTAPYSGGDSYTYTLSDGHGGTDTGTVSITVSAAPTPPSGPQTMSIETDSTSLAWPAGVTVTGTLRNAQSATLGNQPVELWAQPAGGAWGLAGSTSTNGSGVASLVAHPTTGTAYQWRVGSVMSATVSVAVTPHVTASVKHALVPSGASLKFTGVASPVRAGAAVQLQKFSGGVWHTVKSGTFGIGSTSATGGAPYTLKTKAVGSGTDKYRVVVPADAGRLVASSGAVQVKVFRVAIDKAHPTGDEYVTIENTGHVSVDLKGWLLKTGSGHHVSLPHHDLGKGDVLRVHVGHGHSTGSDLYLDGPALLGNHHDVIKLLDGHGLKVDAYSY